MSVLYHSADREATKKQEHPALCRVPLVASRAFIGGGSGVGGFLDRRLHLSRVGLDANLEYVFGGYRRWIGVVEPVVELARLHSGFTTSLLLFVQFYVTGEENRPLRKRPILLKCSCKSRRNLIFVVTAGL